MTAPNDKVPQQPGWSRSPLQAGLGALCIPPVPERSGGLKQTAADGQTERRTFPTHKTQCVGAEGPHCTLMVEKGGESTPPMLPRKARDPKVRQGSSLDTPALDIMSCVAQGLWKSVCVRGSLSGADPLGDEAVWGVGTVPIQAEL